MRVSSPDSGVSSQISTFVYGIGHLISDRMLAIPDYQRSYSWTDDEVSELWHDLQRELGRESKEYFLGSVVTTSTSAPRQQIIDGQQRMATVTLLYSAMRDIFNGRSDERATDVEREFLGKKNMSTRKLEPLLTLNAEDNDVFQRVLARDVEGARRVAAQDSHRRILAAYDLLHEKQLALIEGLPAENWQKPLVDLHEFVRNCAKVIEVNVSNENRAFVIFETLNDRGLNLSTADLLKGHIFGISESRLEEAKNSWARAMAPFAGQRDGADTDTFLRHYWASSRGVARVKALFSEIRREVVTPELAVDLARDLSQSAPLWVNMFDRDSDYWKSATDDVKDSLETLAQLKVEQCRPLLLAAMRSFSRAEVEVLLGLIVAWSIRWFVVGGGSAGVTERLYAESARDVSSGKLTSSQEIAGRFIDRVPSDRLFEEAFALNTVRRGWLARYYLARLEREASAVAQPELVVNTNKAELNLEHVLARNARREDWPAFTDDEFSDKKLVIGNQVLLRQSENESLGNGSFESKRAVLAGSSLLLTAEVGACADWTPTEIDSRGKRLAKLAVGVWPRTLWAEETSDATGSASQ